MARKPTTLTALQQELIGVVRAAHDNLIIARSAKTQEIKRRAELASLQAKQEYERQVQQIEIQCRLDVEREIAAHASARDEALIAAYNAGIPIRRIALDGFGNQHDAQVHMVLSELREEGRVGVRTDYQGRGAEVKITFPQPVDVDSVLSEKLAATAPVYEWAGPFELVPESAPGAGDNIEVNSVLLKMDELDPYFLQIAKNARPGTPYLNETIATLYLHPATGSLTVHESKETGDVLWDHPVARYVKDHPDLARAGFDAAMAAAGFDTSEA